MKAACLAFILHIFSPNAGEHVTLQSHVIRRHRAPDNSGSLDTFGTYTGFQIGEEAPESLSASLLFWDNCCITDNILKEKKQKDRIDFHHRFVCLPHNSPWTGSCKETSLITFSFSHQILSVGCGRRMPLITNRGPGIPCRVGMVHWRIQAVDYTSD